MRETNANAFYIEFTNRDTGNLETKRVRGHALAREVAKSIAIATRRRVIVRRAEAEANRWKVFLFDLENQEAFCAASGISKAEAAKMFTKWNARATQSVCVLWPAWAPPPIIAM